jgi:hypothetical protein
MAKGKAELVVMEELSRVKVQDRIERLLEKFPVRESFEEACAREFELSSCRGFVKAALGRRLRSIKLNFGGKSEMIFKYRNIDGAWKLDTTVG